MAFDYYNVEQRDRVKCVTASEGVPITTQWGKEGYHYCIQVAQFGLAHHAKHLILENPPKYRVHQAGPVLVKGWTLPDAKSSLKPSKDGRGLAFSTADSLLSKGIGLALNESSKKCLKLDIQFTTNGSISVLVTSAFYNERQKVWIHYVFSTTNIWYDGKTNIYFGLGEKHKDWISLSRDLNNDLVKGMWLGKNSKRGQNHRSLVRVMEIRLRGQGVLTNLSSATSVHMEQFYSAADWLVNHQDERGGWPIHVARKVVKDVLELPPGWYSAMGQGQAMSVLVRAYLDSKDKKYLTTAVEALKLFEIDSAQGGVRAKFFGVMDWYEEYPTTPSLFVLNGFIYSLLGLYDLKETATGKGQEAAERIYNSGMKSLKAMIGMYDTGVGTIYDLRHLTAGLEPNRARWDYHTTHINQVLQLMVIDDDPIFKTTAQRWLGYLQGRKSRHN